MFVNNNNNNNNNNNTGCQNTPTQHRLDSLKTEVQKETRKIKDGIAEKTKERWHGKRMHGQLPRNLDERLEDIEQSYRWLKSWRHQGRNRKYSGSSRSSN